MIVTDFIALDLETTGLEPGKDKIIEISICRYENGVLVDSWSSLVRPACQVPLEVLQLTGIDQLELNEAPTWEEIVQEVRNRLEQLPVVGHNVAFDLGFLRTSGLIVQNSYDTCQLARLLLPGLSSYSLVAVAAWLGIEVKISHRARHDAELAGQLFLHLQKELAGRPLVWLNLVASWARPDWSCGRLVRTAAEQALKHGFGQLPPVMEWLTAGQRHPAEDRHPTCPSLSVGEIFGADGPLADLYQQWESRPQQVELAEAIADALAGGQHLVAEAGTGTGKSLAYLIPAALTAISRGEKVVISTNTLSLQEQLLDKDGPVLQWIFPGLKMAPLKGRSNYLCWRRWWALIDSRTSWELDHWLLAGRLTWWLHHTRTGDEAELKLHGNDRASWEHLRAERELCLGNACPWHKCCWVQTNRQAAQKAHLVVTNHSLLCTDIKLEEKILPAYDYLVIDEAHNLEEVAQRHLGLRLSAADFRRWRQGLWWRPFGGQGPLALLDGTVSAEIKGEAQALRSLSQEVDQREEEFWRLLVAGDRVPEVVAENYLLKLKIFLEQLQKLAQQAKLWHEDGLIAESLLSELNGRLNQGQELVETLEIWVRQPFSSWVYWVEEEYICAAPVEVGPILYDQLWSKKKSVIFCSATLAVAGRSEYFAESIGINIAGYLELVLSSPFNYRQQALLLGINEGPDPTQDEERLAEDQAAMLLQLASVTRERVLALFTSYRHLRLVADLMAEPMLQLGRKLLIHSRESSRGRLIQEFKNTRGAVLLGTQSFWEGVDLPGDLLRVVVIMKLPFAVPTYPPIQAKMELCRQSGYNPFIRVSLPRAIIQFKQGFGRLIRTADDWGLVVIMDPRLKSKSYGKDFLKSLPAVRVEWVHPQDIGKKAKTWLEERKMLQ